MSRERCEVLVVGSGAGGATTAYELAHAGRDVLVLEEGRRHRASDYGQRAALAMPALYRRAGMTPIVGRVPIGYVEGCCVGGSTEINSGFWHRTPREVLAPLAGAVRSRRTPQPRSSRRTSSGPKTRSASVAPAPWPKSTEVFARGIEAMGWAAQEVPRAAPGCERRNTCAIGCANGAQARRERGDPSRRGEGRRARRGRLPRGPRCCTATSAHPGVLVERTREDDSRELAAHRRRARLRVRGPDSQTPVAPPAQRHQASTSATRSASIRCSRWSRVFPSASTRTRPCCRSCR